MHHFIAIGEFRLELQSRHTQFGSKSTIFLSPVTFKFDGWPWKTIGHLFYATSRFVHHFITYVNSNWSYGPETAKWGHDLCDLDLWPLTLTCCMDITSVNGNISYKFQDDRMRGTLSKRCGRRTDGQTERRVLRAALSQLTIIAWMNIYIHIYPKVQLLIHANSTVSLAKPPLKFGYGWMIICY